MPVPDAVANFSYSTVATAPVTATAGTSLVVAAGNGVRFPAAPFNVTVWPVGAQPLAGNAEIVRVTAVSVDTFTIARATEGSTARAIVAGDQIAATITAKTLTDRNMVDANEAIRFLPVVGIPDVPPTGIKVFTRSRAGREMLYTRGPDESAKSLARSFATNRIAAWLPPGAGSNVGPGIFGFQTPVVVGTATARSCVTTSYFTRQRRLGYVSVATVGGLSVMRHPAQHVALGTGTMGGFYAVYRFGISDAAAVAGARMFVGMLQSNAAPTNVEPASLTGVIGIGHGAADTNLRLYFGGTTAQTPIDLGVNFPTNTLSTDEYQLILHAPTLTANVVHYLVERRSTGDTPTATASGTLGPGTAGTTLPANANMLVPVTFWRTNNATALAVGIDIVSAYYEQLG